MKQLNKMKPLEDLYTDYNKLKENVIVLYLNTVKGKEIDYDNKKKKGIDHICDTKDELVIGMDENSIYTEHGEYSIHDANILDLMYFIRLVK